MDCNNCYFFDLCREEHKQEEHCEYFSPLFGEENIVLAEFEKDLEERHRAYQEIIEDFD